MQSVAVGPLLSSSCQTQYAVPGHAGGGTYSFFVQTQSVTGVPQGNDSLGITDVNMNGLVCSAVPGQGPIELDSCKATLAAGYPAGAGGGSACLQTFCCGVVLLAPSPPPSPSPPPPSPSPPVGVSPQAPLELPPPPARGDGERLDGTQVAAASPQPAPGQQSPSLAPQGGSVAVSSRHVAGATVPLAVGSAAGAATLAATLWLLARRRRRRARERERESERQLLQSSLWQGQQAAPGGKACEGPDASPAPSSTLPAKLAGWASSMTLAAALGPALQLAPGCTVTILPTPCPAAAVGCSDDGKGGKSEGDAAGPGGAATPGEGGSGSEGGLAEGGDLIGQVVLHEKLGSGAFGVVYAADWGGRRVAVKVLQTACHLGSRELRSFRCGQGRGVGGWRAGG